MYSIYNEYLEQSRKTQHIHTQQQHKQTYTNISNDEPQQTSEQGSTTIHKSG